VARWAFLLGGMIVWAVHFLGLYALASLADTVARADAAGWRMAMLAFSGLCAAAEAALFLWAMRRLVGGRDRPGAGFVEQLAAFGAGLGFIAVVWQALPTVIGF